MPVRTSVLDLCPITADGDARQALHRTLDLAQWADQLGYHRYWLAEHHNMPGIASAATAVVIGQVATHTERIRVGAGGVMLPNHSPLVVAEQFGTLEAYFPGRIDLGLGRAPGTDGRTMRALRRASTTDPHHFPHDVEELIGYFDASAAGASPQSVRAIPGEGMSVPVWILGSSLFGADLAAAFGLPYAFASHFAPVQLQEAITHYRRNFQPSRRLSEPYVMAGYNVFAADTDAEGEYLASSMQQAFVALRRGAPDPLQPPVEGYLDRLSAADRAMVEQTMACSAMGSPERIREQVEHFVAVTAVDELMVTSQIHDHDARRRSYEILADVMPNGSLGR